MIRVRGRHTVAPAVSLCAPASSGESGVISGSLDPLDPNATTEVLSYFRVQEHEP